MKPVISTVLLLLTIFVSPLNAQDKIGVIIMHGKTGTAGENSPVGVLASYLNENGVHTITPDMPWHRERMLDKNVDDSMIEIDQHVTALKKKGYTKIIVGGQSMGANAALIYGSSRDGLTAVMAIAPGHVPEIGGYQRRLEHDYLRAQKMVDAGKGKEKDDFKDRNQGSENEFEMEAQIYLSWYDPEGMAVMPDNAGSLKPNTPLLWAVGTDDRMFERGEEYAFSEAPEHPKNIYIVVDGGHRDTAENAQEQILNWLKSL